MLEQCWTSFNNVGTALFVWANRPQIDHKLETTFACYMGCCAYRVYPGRNKRWPNLMKSFLGFAGVGIALGGQI